MDNLKTFEQFTNEEADYRNVSGYGTDGNPSNQHPGASFNSKSTSAAIYQQPEMIGQKEMTLEDPYFNGRKSKMKRVLKNKDIEKLRKKGSEKLKKLDQRSGNKLIDK